MGPALVQLGWLHPTMPLVASQVNITLLDINDNHPTWKDAPYYINLVEMTPPDSDVTTVSGGTAEMPGYPSERCLPFSHGPYGPTHVGLIDLMFPSGLAPGAEFQKLSCMVRAVRGRREALTQSSGTLSEGTAGSPRDSAKATRVSSALTPQDPGHPLRRAPTYPWQGAHPSFKWCTLQPCPQHLSSTSSVTAVMSLGQLPAGWPQGYPRKGCEVQPGTFWHGIFQVWLAPVHAECCMQDAHRLGRGVEGMWPKPQLSRMEASILGKLKKARVEHPA